MTDVELFSFIENTARPALEQHVLRRGRYRLSREDIQDVVQETFLRLINRRHTSIPDPLMPWLYHVANNILIDRWRRSGKVTMTDLDESLPAPKNDDDDDVLFRAAFRKAFLSLTDSEQEILRSMSIGKTQSEIAEDFEVSQTTIARRIQAAMERIRQHPALLSIPEAEKIR